MRLFGALTVVLLVSAACRAGDYGAALPIETKVSVVGKYAPVSELPLQLDHPTVSPVVRIATDPTVVVSYMGDPKPASGTVVRAAGGKSYVLTCAHVYPFTKQLDVIVSGRKFPAREVKADPRRDLKLLEVDAELTAAPVAAGTPPAGTPVAMRGARGPKAGATVGPDVWRGPPSDPVAGQPVLRTTLPSEAGDSGAGVFAAGQLVAVNTGGGGGNQFGIPAPAVRGFLAESLPATVPTATASPCPCGDACKCPLGDCKCGPGCLCGGANAAKPDYDPYRLGSYAEVLAQVGAGLTVRMYVRVPDTSVGTYRLHYHTDGFPAVAAGVYDCSKGPNGELMMSPVGAPAPAPIQTLGTARVGGGDHTHTCGRCGTVFDHSPAGDPSRSHRCPACGAGPWTLINESVGGGRRVMAQPRPAAYQPPAAPPQYSLNPRMMMGMGMGGAGCGPGG